MVLQRASLPLLWLPSPRCDGTIIVATATAALVAELVGSGVHGVDALDPAQPSFAFFRMCAPMYTLSVCLYTPIVAALTIAYTRVSPWTLPLFFIPALAAQRLFGLYQQQRQLTAQLVDANIDLENANLSFATALVTTLDARDRYTAGHSAAVAIYARDIAVRMGFPDEESGKAHLAGLVHDVGKIGLSAGVLEKPGALTLEERREMQRHSEIGERILNKVASYAEIASIVRHHHERVDGGGYPDGLTDEADTASVSHHRSRGRLQRHDIRPSVPRRDAEPSRQASARASGRISVRYLRRSRIRSRTRHGDRAIPHGAVARV